jgi:diguanylate cyclase (GGDEF)-like protein
VRGGANLGSDTFELRANDGYAADSWSDWKSFSLVTRLPNRASLEEHLRDALSRSRRQDKFLVLMIVDVGGIREISELLGFGAGDALLDAAVKRLRSSLDEADFVARVGSDQFAVVLEDAGEAQNAVSVAQRIVADMARPFPMPDHQTTLTANIGISYFPQDGSDAKTLLRSANSAVSRAKEQDGSPYQFFSPDLNARALEALAITNKLRLALARNEFTLHYQPLVELRSGRVMGTEALLRWLEPEMGMIPPSTFIPLAERRGMIGAIGDWVLEAACRQAREWQLAGFPPLRMAVNLSLAQLREADLARKVSAILRSAELGARTLALEVTETFAMQDPETTVTVLSELHQMGVALAIDDFGTGYSSLSYLKRFPVDYLKIDRSFIRGIPADRDDMAIARTIIAMARSLDIRLIAEGVETEEQRAFLANEGCDEAQGFLFGKPIPPDELAPLLRSGAPWPWDGKKPATRRPRKP